MAVTLNYNVSFNGRVVIPTEDAKKGAEVLNKLVEAREAGGELKGFDEYLSRSGDLEIFIQRCVVNALRTGIKQELVGDNFRSVGNIKVSFNG